jgi:hypothetical protein
MLTAPVLEIFNFNTSLILEIHLLETECCKANQSTGITFQSHKLLRISSVLNVICQFLMTSFYI